DMTKRAKGRLIVRACDVASSESVRAFARAFGDAPLDVLLNNAGVYGGGAQTTSDMDYDDALHTYSVNALGPLRVSLALRANLARGENPRIVHVTSGMGSIQDNRSGGFYAYRMSKAALNMASRTLAVDLAPERIASVVINPGWVQTDMGGPSAPTSAEDSVRGMLLQIDSVTLSRSGTFLHWSGGEFPW
ncbi:MAG: SDR family oxidoreductase, partial [Deltaproteobacteria bacterium]